MWNKWPIYGLFTNFQYKGSLILQADTHPYVISVTGAMSTMKILSVFVSVVFVLKYVNALASTDQQKLAELTQMENGN